MENYPQGTKNLDGQINHMSTVDDLDQIDQAAPIDLRAQNQLWQSELEQYVDRDFAPTYVELSTAHPTGLAQLYAGRPTRLSSLVREPRALAHCRINAREVMKSARSMESRYGIGPVYLAIGTATWKEGGRLGQAWEYGLNNESEVAFDATENGQEVSDPQEQRLVTGPALLCPLQVGLTSDDDILFTLDPAVELWPVLEKALVARGEQGGISEILGLARRGGEFSPNAPLEPLREMGRNKLLGFDLYDSMTIGQYIHPISALVKDLQENQAAVMESDLVKALLGDAEAAADQLQALPTPVKSDRDPNLEHGIGDLDAAQHNALDAVASGINVILDSPPGSEALQTIAALLADTALSGRSIAYVPGMRRKAQQTVRALEKMGLQDFCLDLSRANTWQVQVPQALLESLGGDPNAVEAHWGEALTEEDQNYSQAVSTERNQLQVAGEELVNHPEDLKKMRAELVELRTKLGGYMAQLHAKRAPWGISAYDSLQVLADLTAMRPGPRTRIRFDLETLHKIAADGAQKAQEVLAKAQEAGLFQENRAANPWYGVVISGPDTVPEVIRGVSQVSQQSLPRVRGDIDRAIKETGLLRARTLDKWREQLQMLEGVREVLDVFEPQVFERSAADMVIATGTKKWRKENALNMSGSQQRRLIKQAKELVRPGRRVEDLHQELIKVQEQRRIWREYSEAGGYPILPTDLDRMKEAERRLRADLEAIQPYFRTAFGDLEKYQLDDLVRLMDALAADRTGAKALPERVKIMKEITDLGLKDLVDDLRERRVVAELIPMELDLAWWASALSEILALDDRLARYDGEYLESLASRLRELDLLQVHTLAPQVRRQMKRQRQRQLSVQAQDAEQLQHLLQRGVRPNHLAEIFDQYPLASELRPIRIIPPVLVPRLLSVENPVDVLILDGIEGASLAELIPALIRAEQVVIIGDTRRNQSDCLDRFTRIFPAVKLPPTRSRVNEWVAGFLADHNYGPDVLSVSVPRQSTAVSLQVVDGRGMPAPGVSWVESSAAEVEAVVQAVLDHVHLRPENSLAVVALNPRHAQRISEALVAEVAKESDLDGFFAAEAEEPFVVLDASNTAGVRRDNVILATGFAKTPHGRILHDFGPISAPEGPTQLVDALNVVRHDLQIISSIDPDELDRGRLRSAGSIMFYDLLMNAKASQSQLSPVQAASLMKESEAQPDRLLLDLAQRLYSVGLTVIPNLGEREGMRIPLAIGHPEYPDELLVAVLTDNGDYVAERSLRARERHWIERLEDYGWEVMMVYSTAVFMNPQAQAQRILDRVLDVVEERQAVEGVSWSGVVAEEEVPQVQAEVPDLVTPVTLEDRPSGWAAIAGVHGSSAELEWAAKAQSVGKPMGQRPPIAPGLPLAAYSDDQLDDLILWIRSDQVVREEDEELEILCQQLGQEEITPQAEVVLRNALRRN